MIEDIWTVMWKEFKETLPKHEIKTGIIPRLLVPVFLLGVFLPWQFGREWVGSPMALLNWIWLTPFIMTSQVVDSFAGERERHTLETLLASRLPDRAILFGKICVAVGYGWGITLASMLVGLVTLNLVYGTGGILLYSPYVALTVIAISFLVITLVASVGVLVSLRAPTVRYAQQTLSIGFIILYFAVIFGIQAIPVEWKASLTFLTTLSETDILIYTIAFLAILNIGFIVLAMARFKRARLILD